MRLQEPPTGRSILLPETFPQEVPSESSQDPRWTGRTLQDSQTPTWSSLSTDEASPTKTTLPVARQKRCPRDPESVPVHDVLRQRRRSGSQSVGQLVPVYAELPPRGQAGYEEEEEEEEDFLVRVSGGLVELLWCLACSAAKAAKAASSIGSLTGCLMCAS